MKITPSTRRQFVRQSAVLAAGFTILPRHVLGGPRFVPPSEKVNIALVGAGGNGLGNVQNLLQLDDIQIIAVVDPAESYTSARGDEGQAERVRGRKVISASATTESAPEHFGKTR
ncbi:MAG: hypothetical protein HY735_14080 [Verrucomicrobia bacterium]|nr:hypothetical protein [Verrucomicrobiota bacterium]